MPHDRPGRPGIFSWLKPKLQHVNGRFWGSLVHCYLILCTFLLPFLMWRGDTTTLGGKFMWNQVMKGILTASAWIFVFFLVKFLKFWIFLCLQAKFSSKTSIPFCAVFSFPSFPHAHMMLLPKFFHGPLLCHIKFPMPSLPPGLLSIPLIGNHGMLGCLFARDAGLNSAYLFLVDVK